jgi:hypothetical protein
MLLPTGWAVRRNPTRLPMEVLKEREKMIISLLRAYLDAFSAIYRTLAFNDHLYRSMAFQISF